MSATTASPSREDLAEDTKSENEPNGSGDAPSSPRYGGITKLRNFLRTRRLEMGMLITRFLCVYSTVFYIFPIFGDSTTFFGRALVSNVLTSGMRLYQRLGVGGTPCSISREFIGRLLLEDSCHYLFYSIMFLYFGQISFSLIPILLFSSLHVANFTLQMLEVAKGPAVRLTGFGSFLFFCTSRTPWVLKMAASAEIALMGVILLNMFRGSVSVLALFAYYRFLYLRYASKRNHYTRIVFTEMRMAVEAVIANGCPSLIARIIQTFIVVLCKLAPAAPAPANVNQ